MWRDDADNEWVQDNSDVSAMGVTRSYPRMSKLQALQQQLSNRQWVFFTELVLRP